MTRKHFATAGWLFVAALTFALGWVLRPIPEGSESPKAKEANGVGKASSVSSILDTGYGMGGLDDAGATAKDSGATLAVVSSRRALSRSDIDKLGDRFKTTLDPIERRLAFALLLEGLTADNALDIRAKIEDLPADSSEFREFHFAWGKVGGVDSIMHGAGTDKADMGATFAGWASAEPDAALQWYESLDMQNDPRFDVVLKDQGISEERMRGHLVRGLVHGLATTDTGKATEFVVSLAASGDKQAEGLLGIVTGNVLRADGAVEAAQWAEGLPEGSLRTAAMGKVAYAYAQQNPAAAAEWAGSFVHEENGGRIVHGITNQWAKRDGEAAVAWLTSLGDAPGRSGAYYSAFEGWARQDAVAASEYLAQMPTSPERDNAISGLVSRHRWEDPVASIVWADSISSEKARLEALTRAGQAWTRLDAVAAAEWATSSGLPPKLQEAIVNPPRSRGK